MKYNLHFFNLWMVLGFLLLGTNTICYSQVDIESSKNNASIKQVYSRPILELKGYFLDYFYMEMNLHKDEDIWTGELEIPGQGIRHILEGGPVDGQVLLMEYDLDEEHVGYWILEEEDGDYSAKWSNLDKSMTDETSLRAEDTPFKIINEKQKIRTFEGSWKNKKTDLVFHYNLGGEMIPEFYFPDQGTSISVEIQCLNELCTKKGLFFHKDTEEEEFIEYEIVEEGVYLKSGYLTGELLSEKFNKSTRLKRELTKDYYMVIEFPWIDQKSTRSKVNRQVDALLSKLKKQLDEITGHNFETGKRYENFVNCWFEVTYWSDLFISGKWVVQKSWNNEAETIPINYSLKSGQEFKLDRQFRDDFDLEFYLSQFTSVEKRNLPEYKDLLLRNSLEKASFEHVNFSKKGVVLSSEFGTLFGAFELTIPYEELKEYSRKKSMLNGIIKELEGS